MKLTKQDVCVFIENESQLQEARELLERFNSSYDNDTDLFKSMKRNGWMWLQLYQEPNDWYFSHKRRLVEITLPELEQILKEEHGSK